MSSERVTLACVGGVDTGGNGPKWESNWVDRNTKTERMEETA